MQGKLGHIAIVWNPQHAKLNSIFASLQCIKRWKVSSKYWCSGSVGWKANLEQETLQDCSLEKHVCKLLTRILYLMLQNGFGLKKTAARQLFIFSKGVEHYGIVRISSRKRTAYRKEKRKEQIFKLVINFCQRKVKNTYTWLIPCYSFYWTKIRVLATRCI